MAQITCPDCGNPVSDAGPACMHCGRSLAPARAAAPYSPLPAFDPMGRRVDERAARTERGKGVALLVYGLQLLGFLYFVPAILGVVIAYLKRGEARGNWVESHFDWQIATFWISLWGAAGALLVGLVASYVAYSPLYGLLPAGVLGLVLVVWYVYRIVRGALAWKGEKPIG